MRGRSRSPMDAVSSQDRRSIPALRSKSSGWRSASGSPSSRTWLLLVHQLPAHPSNLRVQTWRRLQQVGAIPVKQAVYALPDTPEAREDFEWLKAEITGAGGEATVFAADNVDAWSDEALVQDFKRARETSYKEFGRDLE